MLVSSGFNNPEVVFFHSCNSGLYSNAEGALAKFRAAVCPNPNHIVKIRLEKHPTNAPYDVHI